MIVRDHLEKQASERPSKVALLFKDEKITFSDLNTMSNRLANRLLNAGVKKGDRVVLLFQNCPEFCVSLLRCPENWSHCRRPRFSSQPC